MTWTRRRAFIVCHSFQRWLYEVHVVMSRTASHSRAKGPKTIAKRHSASTSMCMAERPVQCFFKSPDQNTAENQITYFSFRNNLQYLSVSQSTSAMCQKGLDLNRMPGDISETLLTHLRGHVSLLLIVYIWCGTEPSREPWAVWDIGGGLQAGRRCSINSSPAWGSQGQSSRSRLCRRVIKTNRPRRLLTVYSFRHCPPLLFRKRGNIIQKCVPRLWSSVSRSTRTFTLCCSARVSGTLISVYIHTTQVTANLLKPCI